VTSPDFSYFQLECPHCSETRSFIDIHTLDLAVDLTQAQLRSVAGGGYHGRVKQLVICPLCDAYALMQEWEWGVPFYSSHDDCVVTVHDYANVDASSILSFGDVEFTHLALVGALETYRLQLKAKSSYESEGDAALDRGLLKLAGIADISSAQEVWEQQLVQLLARSNDSVKLGELDAAVRIILRQKPEDLPWRAITSTPDAAEQSRDDVERVVAYADHILLLADVALPREYGYSSLSLCVIDAVYSIGVKYEGVQAAVLRYCQHFHIPEYRLNGSDLPHQNEPDSLRALCDRISDFGAERMAEEVFGNRQRTSTRNGILKAEAVARFAGILIEHGINFLQDIQWPPPEGLEHAIKNIPGQRSGISLQYFWMLAGSDDLIKPDRMVLRFLREALQRGLSFNEAQYVLSKTTEALKPAYPHLTPRLLDHAIWKYQRQLDAG
jgi:hypothetical protein